MHMKAAMTDLASTITVLLLCVSAPGGKAERASTDIFKRIERKEKPSNDKLSFDEAETTKKGTPFKNSFLLELRWRQLPLNALKNSRFTEDSDQFYPSVVAEHNGEIPVELESIFDKMPRYEANKDLTSLEAKDLFSSMLKRCNKGQGGCSFLQARQKLLSNGAPRIGKRKKDGNPIATSDMDK